MEPSPFLYFILFLLLFAGMVYVLVITLGPAPIAPYEPVPTPLPECRGGDAEDCMKGSCAGTRTCEGGSWGSCRLDIICVPGKLYGCEGAGCSSGYRKCDACGTGFGPCVTAGSNGSEGCESCQTG